MPTELASYTLLVTVNGTPLPGNIAALLAGGYVDDSRGMPAAFALRFTDDDSAIFDNGGFTIGAAIELAVQGADNTGSTPLLRGEITALETEIDAAGAHLIVRGMDASHRLYRGKRVAAYVQMTAADIVRKIAQLAGLPAGRIDVRGPVLDHVAQNGLSDWEFLSALARESGAVLAVVDGALQFTAPAAANSAPGGTAEARQDPLVIEHGVNLVTLRATLTAADQVPTVEVRGWDTGTKKALVSVSNAATSSAELNGATPSALAGSVNSPKWIEPASRFGRQEQCDARAGAVADRLAGSFAELDGVVRGNPTMRSGKAVALTKVGKPFDGSYTLSATRHEFSPETGYQTSFTVSNASDRSLYGISAGGGSLLGGEPSMQGVIVGIVTDVKDPVARGRVKVSIPVLSDEFESRWCRVLQPGAGAGRGVVWLPEVGDEVLLAFGMGHIDEPYVLGGLYNGTDTPATAWSEHVDKNAGTITRRALVSRTGMVVEMIETAQDEKLTLSTNDGAQRITLVQKGQQAIEIVATGPVTVSAEQDATVTSTTGDVSVSATNITLDAKSELKLNGANIKIAATAEADLSGAMVKVSGDASAELSGGATTTVKGALVRIN